jgi:hypothetical protein
MDQIQDGTSLKIGDLVTLRALNFNGFLSSEGIIVEELGVSRRLRIFEDHLFQVCIQLQYSVKDGYAEFMTSNTGVTTATSDDERLKHQKALLRGKENEVRMNETFMHNNTGVVVKLGEIIQLKHVKSGKFVTVKKNELARDERANLKVSLSAEGSTDSWLQILPRFKIHKEGDRIHSGMEVLLRLADDGEYIHCATKKPHPRKLREVNCAVDGITPWCLQVYRSFDDIRLDSSSLETSRSTASRKSPTSSEDLVATPNAGSTFLTGSKEERDNILGGQIVVIKDPETQSALTPFDLLPVTSSTILERCLKDADDQNMAEVAEYAAITTARSAEHEAAITKLEDCDDVESIKDDDLDGEERDRLERIPLIDKVKGFQSTNAWSLKETFSNRAIEDDDEEDDQDKEASVDTKDVSSFSEVVLSSLEEERVDSNALWIVESMNVVRGGKIYCRKGHMHIRHLNTGMYLALTDTSYRANPFEIFDEEVSPRAGMSFGHLSCSAARRRMRSFINT